MYSLVTSYMPSSSFSGVTAAGSCISGTVAVYSFLIMFLGLSQLCDCFNCEYCQCPVCGLQRVAKYMQLFLVGIYM